MEIRILLFYKYVPIENPQAFLDKHLRFCKSTGLLGRILVAKEGINGSVAGTEEQVEKYKKELTSDSRFSDIVFKEDIGVTNPFTKMKVLLRNEIVRIGVDVNMSQIGDYLEPEEFLTLYENGKLKDEYVLIDARNDYEYRVGKFKDALDLNIKTFREFPQAVEKLKEMPELKGKKIVTYCTGGIRCEKASAYLKSQGFEDVSQLHGGIITFGKQYPNSVWEGKCFVFDKRLLADVNEKDDLKCDICGEKCDLCRNCRNVDCDKLHVSCLSCETKYNGCCSEECFKQFKLQCMEKSYRKQNRRQTNVIKIQDVENVY